MAIKILQLIKNNNIRIILFVFYNCFNNKRIMFDQKQQINQEIDLHQKRKFFSDPKDICTHAITNLLIYCSQYYPSTKSFIINILDKITPNHQTKLYESIEHLYKCLQREILSGPSSSYIPPSQIPHSARLDNSFQSSQNIEANKFKEFVEAFQSLNLLHLIPKGRIKEIFWYSSSRLLSMKSVQENNINHKFYISQLEIDGQNWLESTPFTSMFVMLSFILETIVKKTKFQAKLQIKFKLLRARLGQLHNKCLKNPVGKLAEIVLQSYKEVITLSVASATLEDHIQLLLEYAYSLLFFYKYSQSQQVVRHCAKLLKMKVQFTGKLGRRTKYQVFDTPQLVMNLVQTHQQENTKPQQQVRIHDEQEGQKIEFIDPKQLVLREKGIEKSTQKGISVSTFDEQSILLESPKFVEEEEKQTNKLKQINQSHLLVALAMLYLQWKSTSKDEMLQQSIAAAITTLLKYQVPTSFSYNFSLLLFRSLNEFSRVKNFERALDQLQKLRSTFNGQADKDVSDIYSTPYQTCLGYILLLADKYIEIGLSITAVQLYQQAGLYEECIDGLIFKNYKEKALELANELIDRKGKNPRLLCMLGDINNSKDPKFYEQAWQLSKGTYARAQRSLGWYYYNQNNYEKAAESFHKATQANYYHPNTWFTLGCCYMRLNQFDKALKAFSETISIDDSQGQAWGNMASCYMYQKKMKQAYSTLTQAVKHSQGNWKLWANLLSVSLSLKQFYKYFECLERIVKLGQHQIITEDILGKVVMIMRFTNQSDQRRRILFNYKNRIDRLFALFQQKIGQIPLVWRIKTKYLIEILEYYDILNVHYHNLHVQNKIDPNDLVPQYETLQSTHQTTIQRTRQTKNMIVAAKQNELNMSMNVGWNQNKIQCQKVKIILEDYVQIYKKYSEKADLEDFKLFVKGATQKISACFQTVYQLPLQF